MQEIWYLVITLFILQPDGNIQERALYSLREDSLSICRIEADARIELFTPYLGKDHIRRYHSGIGYYCNMQVCQEDKDDDGTYVTKLHGTLLRFEVGCENRADPFRNDDEWKELGKKTRGKRNGSDFHSF